MSQGEAGASAQDKYAALTRAWRRRKRKLFLALSGICGSVFVLSVVGWHLWPHLAFMFGLWGGAAMSFWLMARDSPPAWIEQWRQGAFGEQATGKQLKRLEREGWIVLHDLPRGNGNVDHVLVGPGGVFVLDSKRTDGRVVIKDGTVTVRRLDDPELRFVHTGTPHLIRLARETHDRVLGGSRINQWVTPVMVWWADFPQRVVEERCVYVHGEELVTWLQARPTKIAPSRLTQVADAVQAAWLPAEDTVPSGDWIWRRKDASALRGTGSLREDPRVGRSELGSESAGFRRCRE